MASPKQISANRANSKKSTGPRSPVGKARSSLNSLKHGLTAQTLVIGDEDPREFEALRSALMEQYDPQLPDERELVEYLAGVLWRLRRIPLFAAGIFSARQAQVAQQMWEEEARARDLGNNGEDAAVESEAEVLEETSAARWLIEVGRTLIKDAVWNDVLGKLDRHEATLANLARKTITKLDEMRERPSKHPVTLRGMTLPAAASRIQ